MTQFIDSYPSHSGPSYVPPASPGGQTDGLGYNSPIVPSHAPSTEKPLPRAPEAESDTDALGFYVTYADEVRTSLQELPWAQINVVVQTIVRAWQTGHHIYIMGNGGSAATATHLACDLAKNTAQPGLARVQAVSLNDNIAMMSALANDIGYDQIFAEQIRTLVKPMDVVIAISTSGNSPNVLEGVEAARERKAITLGITGYSGGQLAAKVHVPVITANHCVEQIEDLHMVLAHMITVAVRRELQQALRRRAGHD